MAFNRILATRQFERAISTQRTPPPAAAPGNTTHLLRARSAQPAKLSSNGLTNFFRATRDTATTATPSTQALGAALFASSLTGCNGEEAAIAFLGAWAASIGIFLLVALGRDMFSTPKGSPENKTISASTNEPSDVHYEGFLNNVPNRVSNKR